MTRLLGTPRPCPAALLLSRAPSWPFPRPATRLLRPAPDQRIRLTAPAGDVVRSRPSTSPAQPGPGPRRCDRTVSLRDRPVHHGRRHLARQRRRACRCAPRPTGLDNAGGHADPMADAGAVARQTGARHRPVWVGRSPRDPGPDRRRTPPRPRAGADRPRPPAVRPSHGRARSARTSAAEAASRASAPRPKLRTRTRLGRQPRLAQRRAALQPDRSSRSTSTTPRPATPTGAPTCPGDPARDVPLPHQDAGLVRHRLQLPRRPVRPGLGGPVRRPDRLVRGAHTLGFNAHSVGIAVIGNLDLATAGARPWHAGQAGRLEARQVRPRRHGHGAGHVPRAATSTPTAERVRLPVIDGHRDTNDTACPGSTSTTELPEIRKPHPAAHRPLVRTVSSRTRPRRWSRRDAAATPRRGRRRSRP